MSHPNASIPHFDAVLLCATDHYSGFSQFLRGTATFVTTQSSLPASTHARTQPAFSSRKRQNTPAYQQTTRQPGCCRVPCELLSCDGCSPRNARRRGDTPNTKQPLWFHQASAAKLTALVRSCPSPGFMANAAKFQLVLVGSICHLGP